MTYIFPAIDLMDGQCVRLNKGDFASRVTYSTDPLEIACQFEADGADWLHVVDLDGARDGERKHARVIGEIVRKTGLRVQTGGGLRERDDIESLLNQGVERVVLGSLCVTDPYTVSGWMEELGSRRIVLALDVKAMEGSYRPAVRGWTEVSDKTVWAVLDDYPQMQTVLMTDISRDGMMGGGNLDLYGRFLERYPEVDLITSGGVGSLADIVALKNLDPYGIIVGKALYENKVDLREAIAC